VGGVRWGESFGGRGTLKGILRWVRCAGDFVWKYFSKEATYQTQDAHQNDGRSLGDTPLDSESFSESNGVPHESIGRLGPEM